MKDKIKNISKIGKVIFGYGIMISLFLGGISFFGYLIALCIGGEIATAICVFCYEKIIPVAIYLASVMVLFGLITMYMAGEVALTAKKEKKKS